MSQHTMQRAVENVRRTQSPLALRKESLSALVALVVWVATLIVDNIDAIPAATGAAGDVLGVAASLVAYGLARFTVPAVTKGQEQRLIAETARVEKADQDAARPLTLPVYTGPTVEQVTNAD